MNGHQINAQPEIFCKPVRYCWSLRDGTICHGSTVVTSRTRKGLRSAVKKFWQRNTHTAPEVGL